MVNFIGGPIMRVSVRARLAPALPLSSVGTAAGARMGILIRHREARESPPVTTNHPDNTGTVTRIYERPRRLSRAHATTERILHAALPWRSGSEHPLARAIVVVRPSRGSPSIPRTAVDTHPGFGVSGMVDGHAVVVGTGRFSRSGVSARVRWRADEGGRAHREDSGVCRRGRDAGSCHRARRSGQADISPAISELHSMGLRVVMLTGDIPRGGGRRTRLGVEEYIAGCSRARRPTM